MAVQIGIGRFLLIYLLLLLILAIMKRCKIQQTKLLLFGGRPGDILRPFVFQALETALLPTLNSMVGMGIVSLPGMMTGQILSGTLPTTAILYQIAIMIAICTVVCLSVFGSLYFGHKTLYNSEGQFTLYRIISPLLPRLQ